MAYRSYLEFLWNFPSEISRSSIGFAYLNLQRSDYLHSISRSLCCGIFCHFWMQFSLVISFYLELFLVLFWFFDYIFILHFIFIFIYLFFFSFLSDFWFNFYFIFRYYNFLFLFFSFTCLLLFSLSCRMSWKTSHLRHMNLFPPEIIRILHQSGTPFRNSDVIISKWSTGSVEYSDYFQKK